MLDPTSSYSYSTHHTNNHLHSLPSQTKVISISSNKTFLLEPPVQISPHLHVHAPSMQSMRQHPQHRAFCRHRPTHGSTHQHRPRVNSAAAAAKQAPQVPLPPPDVLQEEQSHGLWHRGVHFVASEVRDYELDQFQVVNNAIYASYVQHGRHKAFSSLGLSVTAIQQSGVLMALSELALQYKAPLRAGDVFYVTSAVSQLTAARLVVDHTVQQVGQQGTGDSTQVVCQGQATIVFLSEDYKPIRVPPHIKQAFTKLHQDYKAGLSTAAANP